MIEREYAKNKERLNFQEELQESFKTIPITELEPSPANYFHLCTWAIENKPASLGPYEEIKENRTVEVENCGNSKSIYSVARPIDIPYRFSDSEDKSDENYLPFKKYSKISSKKRSSTRYKRKLKLIRMNSDTFVKDIYEDCDQLEWSNEITDIIDNKVIPEWTTILQQKKVQELLNNVNTSTKQRLDAVWKKILRDARKFYRLLFHYYQHRHLDKQIMKNTDESKQSNEVMDCLLSFFGEMNFEKFATTRFAQLARYFIENRKFKNIALNLNSTIWQGNDESLGAEVEETIFENFSERKLKVYINDPLFAILLNLVFSKYGEIYKRLMHPKAKKKICSWVNILINEVASTKVEIINKILFQNTFYSEIKMIYVICGSLFRFYNENTGKAE